MNTYYKNIIVAVDGSKNAEYALHKAINVSKQNVGSTLYLVNVIDTRSFAAIEAFDRSISEKSEPLSKELLEGYKKIATDAGLTSVDLILEYGSPRSLISNTLPKKVNADLIVCGANGLTAFERFLIGSVSDGIVRSSKCDVLVVRNQE